ncbi:MAG: ribosome silencing factor [Gammaproteobacteria bacterium]
MDSRSLRDIALRSLEDHKAADLVSLDVRQLTDVADFMILATGGSSRQVKALARYLLEDTKKSGAPNMGVEGLDTADWVLVDLVDVIVHVMVPEAREQYRLEELWGDPALVG